MPSTGARLKHIPLRSRTGPIRERLFHIHIVHHGLLWVTGPRTAAFEFKRLEDFPSMADLKKSAQQGLREMQEHLTHTNSTRMEEVIEVPWFKPPANTSVRRALTQAAMHSHYHRGQNATRLRKLGGVPPMTDCIEWLRNGQPAAQWS